jgi:REP element-mobilizing transposase RayT
MRGFAHFAILGFKRLKQPRFLHCWPRVKLSLAPFCAQVIGYIKGKSAIHVARVYGERKRNFVGQHFWARGYFVSTVGRDEEVIRRYIRDQEKEDERLEQLNLV